MTFTGISSVRSLFPVTATRAYLFAGGLCPAAAPVKAAVDAWSERWMFDPGFHRARYFEEWRLLKECFARLINAQPDEVAIVDSTSRGSNIIVQMLSAPLSSNVVVDETTYPSSLQAWMLPAKAHVELRLIRSHEREPRVDELAAAIDNHTVAVSVSHVSQRTGFRHDLDAIARQAHSKGAFVIVDAAQSAGAVSLDVAKSHIDFLSCCSMKWLLGPPGVAFMYARREHLDSLLPPHVGHVGTTVINGTEPTLSFATGAQRHEIGLGSLPGIPAARQGIEILLGAGMPAVEEHIEGLTAQLIEELEARAIDVHTPRDPSRRAGVVAFTAQQPERLAQFLRDREVDVWGYEDEQRVRVDPHLYNNSDDLIRFLSGLDKGMHMVTG